MLLHHFFEKAVDTFPEHLGLICDNSYLSYTELEIRSNQLANYMRECQIQTGSRVAILIERSLDCYIAILAVLKTGAAYIPVEVDYPAERINYILSDANVDLVITSSHQRTRSDISWPKVLQIDAIHEELTNSSNQRINIPTAEQNGESLCYIIYTSGSTGKPKGVAITHNNICHYVKVASDIYNMTPEDKVYQGFSLAFDASLEELWMAFANGACLVACTSKEIRTGLGLLQFLKHHQVTMFSTIPTLLSTLEGELPSLRLLILGGETCSTSLVKKWTRPGLTIMNTYGPTEATVIATYSECKPETEVTIGQPLPGYDVVLLNEQRLEVSFGEAGELCIGGPAVAQGYINRPEQTADKFIIDPRDPNKRLYRTGDLAIFAANGDIQFLGRVDDQIKLRGFRIELNEIETVLMKYEGISQAVVALQTLDQPTLVAYLLLDKNKKFSEDEFKMFMRANLPDYMIPPIIEILEAFPLLTSGKVNRKELPQPTQKKPSSEFVAPVTELERKLSKIWENVLNISNISVNADFFYDLGGHSLLAAQIISELRTHNEFRNVSILDLYKNPNIKQLAEKFKSSVASSQSKESKPYPEKYKVPQWKYYLCSIGQFFGCLFQYAVGAWQLLAIVLFYSWLSSENALISLESELEFLTLFFSMPILSLAITVCMKWLLLGRVKPGVYPLWGWFYYRWWLVQRLQKNMYLGKYLIGSPLVNWYLSLLGAKVGKNCYIGTIQIGNADLLSIGDNTSLGYDCKLNGYIVEDGWLKIGSIDIGSNCYIGARAVIGIDTQIEDNAILEDMSMLPSNNHIPSESYYHGSPAVPSRIPNEHIAKKNVKPVPYSLFNSSLYGVLHYLGIIFVMVTYYASLIPSLCLISYFYDHGSYLATMFFAIPVGAVLFLFLHYVLIIGCKKLIMNKVKPGLYPIKSLYYLRHWIVVKMLDEEEIFILADTLYFPIFLRFLGAKLGKRVEMGEAPHVIPDLLTIKDGGFTASSVALAWPKMHLGLISFSPVVIGNKGFAGNVSYVESGAEIGDNGLLGCLSVLPKDNKASKANTSWLGTPAVFLPKRELFLGFSETQTYTPPLKLYVTRLAIEFIRVLLPTTFSFINLFSLIYVLDYILDNYSWKHAVAALPISEMFITTGLIGIIVALKWQMLGKLKPLTKPIWNIFIWKNDIIEYSYNYFINTHFTNKALGTPFALWVHRSLGSKIGKRVFTDTAEFSEFDLITIEDDVCINSDTILQTHLYEDRIFKVANLHISSGCNIGVNSIVLYNTVMEKNSSLGSLSLLMKGEHLPENTQWAGVPAQSLQTLSVYTQQPDALSEKDVVTEV